MDIIEPDFRNTWSPKSFNTYITNRNDFDSVIDALSNSTEWSEFLTSLFESRSDFLVDCSMYPINFTLFTELGYTHGSLIAVDSPILIGTQELSISAKYLQDGCLVISNPWHYNDLSNIVDLSFRPEFMFKAPYISTDVYVPFFGRIAIDPVYIHKRYISIKYVISINTGYCNAFILSKENDYELTEPTYVWSGETKISIDVPFGKVDGQSLIRNVGLGTLSIASGASNVFYPAMNMFKAGMYSIQTGYGTGNPSGNSVIPYYSYGIGDYSNRYSNVIMPEYSGTSDPVGTAIASTRMSNSLNSSLANLHSTPSIVAGTGYNFGGWAMDTKSYLIVRYPEIVEAWEPLSISDNPRYVGYAKLKGRPLCRTVKNLRLLKGYTMVDSVHIEGSGFENSLPTERSMIASALSGGVILP